MHPRNNAASAPVLSKKKALQKLRKARQLKTDNIEAVKIFEEVLDIYPELPEAVSGLALIYVHQGRFEKAYPLVQKAVKLAPEAGLSWYLMGTCLHRQYKCDAAIAAFESAEKVGHKTAILFSEKAMCLTKLNRFEEAQITIDHALLTEPGSSNVLQVKAAIHEMKGEVDKAKDCYERVLKQHPGEPTILFRLSDMKRLSQENFEQCDIAHDIFQNRSLTPEQISLLLFARAKEEERRGNYDTAFSLYVQANKLIHEAYPLNRDNITARTNVHIRAFTRELFENFAPFGSKSKKPVFIVGMPRSGTTLVEQILSSHPDIIAAGEIECIGGIEKKLMKLSGEMGSPYPYSFSKIDPGSLKNFARHYTQYVARYVSESSKHITDKMPTNFLNLGLIHLIFPNAKIIHIKRNPLDTGLSCFFKKFHDSVNLSFAFNLEDIGFFYNEYERLMAHWQSLMPEAIFDVQYEDLVENQESVVRNLLKHLELEWNDNCLEFYNNTRGVTTASMHQVRQPIYKKAIGNWQRYEKHLGALIEILEK
ncbi:MAG: tetratricopeptide repeat-containing sulfotransferase family protein [Methyloligellaceae bacterium]